MFLKHKTILIPEKSRLSYTNHGKTMILPRGRGNNVCNWFTLLFAVSMALFHLIFLMYTTTHILPKLLSFV